LRLDIAMTNDDRHANHRPINACTNASHHHYVTRPRLAPRAIRTQSPVYGNDSVSGHAVEPMAASGKASPPNSVVSLAIIRSFVNCSLICCWKPELHDRRLGLIAVSVAGDSFPCPAWAVPSAPQLRRRTERSFHFSSL
jgi:hypothetical protein